jgi:Zn-dependent protease with chaperone function
VIALTRTAQFRWRCVVDRHGATDVGGQHMAQLSRSHLSRGIFGAIAVSLAFGAVASGRDLAGAQQDPAGASQASISQASINQASVNRAAKADRVSAMVASAVPTRTVLLRLDGLSDTSVLVRLPVPQQARNGSSFLTKGDRKMAVACEPMVSVLTEVARQLQPGRCVT